MKHRRTWVLTAGLILIHAAAIAGITTLENGDRVSWDGEYYDFRDSAGVKMIKLWVPPQAGPVRGVFISGHGGGGGDSRSFARDENIRALAVRLGFAVAGLHNFPGRRVYTEGAPVFFRALDAFAALGEHPELAHVPFVIYGSSNGGATTYGFVNYAPQRAICFVANVSAGGAPEVPVNDALKVPGIFIMGQYDALIGERGINRTREMMEYARSKGARWSWAVELKGHEDGNSFDLYMKLVEQSVLLRMPAGADPRKGPVRLKEIGEKEGWLVDQDGWETGFTRIAAYQDYSGDRSRAGWVLNENMACVYRGLATHDHPITVSVREFDPTFNPNTDPGTMYSLGGPVSDPGEEISLVCQTEGLPGWEKVEFFNGADPLGEVLAPADAVIRTRLDGSCLVYCITAVATSPGGRKWVSTPFHFFVRDPALTWTREIRGPLYDRPKRNLGSAHSPGFKGTAPVDEGDSLLISYGLSSGQEATFDASDGQLSPFWEEILEGHDRIMLTARRDATGGSNFNFVRTHDCILTVQSAYGSDGIYLLFRVSDDNDVAWPAAWTGTEKQQFYLNFDAVDVLIDSRSVADICDPANLGMFFSRGFGITSTSTQYQVACGTGKESTEGLIRSRPEPWDMHAVYHSFDQARSFFGIEIESLKTGRFTKAQEWFIPWTEYGVGLEAEPDAGTRLAFAAGFNDRDEGEHFPPGVTSSGGNIHASNSLRWIGKSDPWGAGPANAGPPYNWGEIILGPMAGKTE
jgi:hypothetical protein